MMDFRRLISLAVCAAVMNVLPASVSAKSLSQVGTEMNYRRNLLNDPQLRTYVKTAPEYYVYYGAKFEPKSGIYIGTPFDCTYDGINNAVNTYYDWFVPRAEIHNDNLPRTEVGETKSDHTSLMGMNWNFALKNSQVIDIKDYSNYIYNRIDEIASWGLDVLLIFGKEMNIDDNFNDPELFKECFRFVADYAHTKENIAMVWAPNDTGGLDTTFEEFYPGDEYVDWIGCSLYTMPYFQGNPNNNDAAQMSFIMGPYANPSMRAKMVHEFMVKNDIKKPVMITEGGVGFESPSGIDYTDWAMHQLKMYYADISRRYPEFKCIISFNQYVQGDLYRYDMGKNESLLPLMRELTNDPIFLDQYPSDAPYAYAELVNGMVFTDIIDISSYAYIPKKQNLVVRYLIDGQWISEKSAPPYELKLDNSQVPYGEHTLTCEIYDGSGITQSRNYDISLVPAMDKSAYSDETDNGKCIFTDMADKPAQMRNEVAFLNEKGIVNGVDGTNFAPNNRISRSELATMLMRLGGLEESDIPCGLTDVNKSDSYYGKINAAVRAGLITGYDDNTFRGGRAVTKNEFVAIIARLMQKELGKTIPNISLEYADDIADWAEGYIKLVKDSGIMLERTDGIFYGDSYISRGDAAIMMAGVFRLINSEK